MLSLNARIKLLQLQLQPANKAGYGAQAGITTCIASRLYIRQRIQGFKWHQSRFVWKDVLEFAQLTTQEMGYLTG